MPDMLLIVTVTPTGDATLGAGEAERAVGAFADALNQAAGGAGRLIKTVVFEWAPALPPPGSVLAALVTVLTERGYDSAVIAERIGGVEEDQLWQEYLGPAVDRLEFLLALDGGADDA